MQFVFIKATSLIVNKNQKAFLGKISCHGIGGVQEKGNTFRNIYYFNLDSISY